MLLKHCQLYSISVIPSRDVESLVKVEAVEAEAEAEKCYHFRLDFKLDTVFYEP